MLASEAKRMSSIFSKLRSLFIEIEKACKKGEFSISTGLLTEGEINELQKLGYQIRTHIDDDGDFKQTWINW